MTRVTLRSITAASALIAVLSVGGVASAQDGQTAGDPGARAAQVSKLSEEGAALYQARDYRRANEKFQQAYSIDPDPNLLYNIAKCYEALGDKQGAIDKYELFINSPGADSAGRVKAQESVRVLKGGAPAGGGAGGGPAEPKSHTNIPAIVAFSVGGVGLIVGAITGIMALGKQSDLNTVCTNRACPPKSSGDISSLKTDATISTVGFIVGAVGVVAGGALLVLGRSSTSEKATTADNGVQVSPYIGLGNAGLTGKF